MTETKTFEVGQKVEFRGKEVEISYGPFTSPLGFSWCVLRRADGREETGRMTDLKAIPEPPTFAVGDKVTSSPYVGALVAGPFTHAFDGDPFWVMEVDGKHRTPRERTLTKVMPPEIKIGDKVRIIRAEYAERTHGKIGTVTRTDCSWREWVGDRHPYEVDIEGEGTVWVAELERVDVEDSASDPVKVGDVVRILEDNAFRADVKAGDLFVVQETFRSTWADEDRIRVETHPGSRMERWTFRPQDFEKVPADEVEVHEGVVYDLSARYRDKDGDVWSFCRIADEVRGECSSADRDSSYRITKYSDTLSYAVETFGPLTRI
ncbi:phiSA1p31-related protein [Streptomyces silvensis]|uniref:Uncharacterized protein n=1 Tax=Streptomyces silvensis TaxID=1765722 RepID=A0A0W7X7W6_9ACTN|nr:phiSA1p31-related protein [Streptomyces silvensis]KUF18836.1 hypothetical protein AT728_07320 [Streptomyces silvensis]